MEGTTEYDKIVSETRQKGSRLGGEPHSMMLRKCVERTVKQKPEEVFAS